VELLKKFEVFLWISEFFFRFLMYFYIAFLLSNVEILLDFVWAVELNRFGLELVGLWPRINKAKDNYTSDLRVGIIFVIIMFISGIPLICSLIRVRNDMILVIDNLQITLPLIVVWLKLVIIRWKRTGTCLKLF